MHDWSFEKLRRVTVQAMVLGCLWAPGVAQAQGAIQATFRVETKSSLHRINPNIYGQFLEHFGRIIDGGLWAELLRNRKFYPVDPNRLQVADPWKPDADLAFVSYAIDRSVSLDGISSQRVSLFGDGNGWRGISQGGFDVLGGKTYVAYAWIKASPASRHVAFQLETSEGKMAAQAELSLRPGGWKKYEARLTPERDVRRVVFRIAFDSPGIEWIGAASLMPVDNIDGMRRDVLTLIRKMHPTVIRWPGGGYADSYDWRKAIGPRDRRPPQAILPYGQPYGYNHGMDPGDFGTDEFMEFCQLVGARPYITANFGSGTPRMAAEWVEYCNGPVDSRWGARRAANGHPRPYGVKYWSIGNEVWGHPFETGNATALGYATYFLPIARAMRRVDSNIRIAAVGAFDKGTAPSGWDDVVLKKDWPQVDFLSIHHYFPGGFWPPALTNRPLEKYLATVADPTAVERKVAQILSLIPQVTGGQRKVRIAFDEWGEWDWDFPPPVDTPQRSAVNQFIDLLNKSGLEFNQTWRDGLFDAGMLQTFMRLGNEVPIAIRTHMVNSLGAIRTDSTRAFLTAPGKVMQLYAAHTGATLLKSVAQAPTFDVPEEGWAGISYLNAVATLSQNRRTVFLHLLNLHPKEKMQVRIQLEGCLAESQRDVWQIAPQDFMSRNNFGLSPVTIRHTTEGKTSSNFVEELPPHSATILGINLK